MSVAVAALAPAYAPRRPTETVLYGLVRQHLESFLAHAREHYDGGLPRYVEQELRAYLKCGVFSEGFTRCHCDTCGHDLLVAFSCHGRTICPSCTGRRMANSAAHLVDRVLPDVPVRQYVLSLPFELRRLAAFKADVLTALARIFVEATFATCRRLAPRGGDPREAASLAAPPVAPGTTAPLPTDGSAQARPGDVLMLAPNVLSVKHWDRLLGGVLYALSPRVDWASLPRRSFSVDVLQCPKCRGRLRVIAVITEREPSRGSWRTSATAMTPKTSGLAHRRRGPGD